MNNIAIDIAKARVSKGMTPSEVAAASGVPLKVINDMEDGWTGIKIGDLVKVAVALGIQVSVEFKPVPKKENKKDE
jgi:DNA-binding XRE family transcriptional regulator